MARFCACLRLDNPSAAHALRVQGATQATPALPPNCRPSFLTYSGPSGFLSWENGALSGVPSIRGSRLGSCITRAIGHPTHPSTHPYLLCHFPCTYYQSGFFEFLDLNFSANFDFFQKKSIQRFSPTFQGSVQKVSKFAKILKSFSCDPFRATITVEFTRRICMNFSGHVIQLQYCFTTEFQLPASFHGGVINVQKV